MFSPGGWVGTNLKAGIVLGHVENSVGTSRLAGVTRVESTGDHDDCQPMNSKITSLSTHEQKELQSLIDE